MTPSGPGPRVQDVEDLVRHWLRAAADKPTHPSARRLAELLSDPAGLPFTVGFVDRVIRPEDVHVAARSLQELAVPPPRFLPWHLRLALLAAATASRLAPRPVIAAVRRVLRHLVGHLLIDSRSRGLGRALGRLRASGVRLNVNLLGEAVLGEREASTRLKGIRRLVERPDVDYVSVKVSAAVAPHSPWAFAEAVDDIEQHLLPLFVAAREHGTFVNLDMEEYRDLDLTVAVFTRLLDRPELLDVEAGIVLQAYLPDSLPALQLLEDWAADRRERGGAGIKVRLVKGANLPMERVEAQLRGWPLATWPTKQETDAHYKRILRWALTPEHTTNIRFGIAGHNLFDVAYAWLLAGEREVRGRIEFEMLLGMAEQQAAAVQETLAEAGVGLLLYVPVVHPREFDVAIAYLVRRLEEGASQENFMSAVFDIAADERLFARERERFVASLELAEHEDGCSGNVPAPRRTQDRTRAGHRTDAEPVEAPTGFANTPDTDPSLPANRQWASDVLARVGTSRLGSDLVAAHTVTDVAAIDEIITTATGEGAAAWSTRSGAKRAAVLREAAAELERRRADLIEVMAAECGKTFDQADPEVSEAIDFAAYYADRAEELDRIASTDGAQPVPVRLTVVTPPWNFPIAIPAGSTLAALAAGSPVVIKPATQASRCGSVMVEALWAAGVPREALQLVHCAEGEVGRRLVSHPDVERLILTGAYQTAELFRGFRPDLPLLAETSGKNALVVTPSADLDLAVRDLVQSAFGHAGQKCSAASLGILVGSVATSRRFRRQLVDAVSSLVVGLPEDPTSEMGPLIEPAAGKLLDALTTLGPGERWLVAPRRLDRSGRLWSPGVKTGVRPGSAYHRIECFGPVLGLMSAATLEEAIELQNAVDYGLTAGLHSLDRAEIETWIDRVEAGNLYVNRGITGAIVQRQPFGGWKRSVVGPGTKAGGPSYLLGLVDWEPAVAEPGLLDRAARSDEQAWQGLYAAPRDPTGLTVEQNWLRHLPVPVTVRCERGPSVLLRRVLMAAQRVAAPVTLSTPTPVDPALAALAAVHVVEDDAAWRERLRGPGAPQRVRLIGGDRHAFAEASGGRPDIALYDHPVTASGRVELLPFLREQAISVTAHRFGSPTELVAGLEEVL